MISQTCQRIYRSSQPQMLSQRQVSNSFFMPRFWKLLSRPYSKTNDTICPHFYTIYNTKKKNLFYTTVFFLYSHIFFLSKDYLVSFISWKWYKVYKIKFSNVVYMSPLFFALSLQNFKTNRGKSSIGLDQANETFAMYPYFNRLPFFFTSKVHSIT